MYDCSKELTNFFNNHVALSETQKSEMRNRRSANQKRLKDGLTKNGDPLPVEHVAQGSYAMHTMVQDKDNDYDIDDGAVFLKADLVGKSGADKSPLDARKMVRDALDDGSFSKPPEVRTNCVRVYYLAGYHVDIPVYRKLDDGSLELASSTWKGSNPTEVTDWYNNAVIQQSPDSNNGRQLRRVTRLEKFFMRSRGSWKSKMPSGLELSVLTVEKYVSDSSRDDVSLYETMKAIKNRLDFNLEVRHPVRDEMLTDSVDDANTRFLREKLTEALDNLKVLFDSDCTRLKALKAWRAVYPHDYWKNLISEEEERGKNNAAKNEAASALRDGNAGLATVASGAAFIAASTSAKPVKNTRAYGGKKFR